MLTTGRFAPSPTGQLHFGSLVTAVASYLAARQPGGRWLLRIEDIDKPREQPGATESIIRTLAAFGFAWDGDILYQSQRTDTYREALNSLQGHAYPCTCARKFLKRYASTGDYGIIYPGTCRTRNGAAADQRHAIRVRTHDEPICFTDRIRGKYCQHLESELGDFIILRSDGLFAYQLAVVVDDAMQGVTQIVRGADLLDNTPRQLWLQQLLGYPQPVYAHMPLAMNEFGQKLSKQTHAPAITTQDRLQQLLACLQFLGQTCPKGAEFATLTEFWDWAIRHWDINRVPNVHSRPLAGSHTP